MLKKATTKKATGTTAEAKEKSSLPAGGYEAMIAKAIASLKERNGSSPVAIVKQIQTTHPTIPEDRLKLQVKMALKRMTAKEKLVKVKASYKLAGAEKSKPKKASTKANGEATKKSAPKKKTAATSTKPKPSIAKTKKPRAAKPAAPKKAATPKKASSTKKVTASRKK